MIDAQSLVSVLEAESAYGLPDGKAISHLLLDSRLLAAPAEACFFAIKGPRHNGHLHIAEMYAKGVRIFVVEDLPPLPGPDAFVLVVANSIAALQRLAAHHRQQFGYPVVGITGSNGKTTVKEWAASLAAPLLPVYKSPRSYNSQVGVPLSVWGMQAYHQLALIEAGISLVGEMGRLQAIVKPTHGVFTYLGAAHDAGFTSRQEKFEEKWKLFAEAKVVVYWANQSPLATWIESKQASDIALIGWQWNGQAKRQAAGNYLVQFSVEGKQFAAELPFADATSIENALHAATLLYALGLDMARVVAGLPLLRPLAMRQEWKEGLYGCRILDDTYNNDLDGLQSAVQQLALYNQGHEGRWLILSDLPEVGLAAQERYQQAASIIASGAFDRIWAVGPRWQTYLHLLPGNTQCFANTETLLAALEPSDVAQNLILVKGGRAFGLERVVQRLQRATHGTRLEVDLSALVSNLNFYRARLPKGHRIMAMVKAGAYGAGSFQIASTLAYHKVDYLAVAYADEGAALRNYGIGLPIMVMNASEEQMELCMRHNLEPVIYTLSQLRAWLSMCSAHKKSPAIHLELNTGMNRLGFDADEMQAVLAQLVPMAGQVSLASVFSHLAAADDPSQDPFTETQLARFLAMTQQLQAAWPKPFLRHIANTPGAARLPKAALDMVRLGIGLYGVEVGGEQGLVPVGRLKSIVTQIRTVPAGESVSYGHKWVLAQPKRIATVAIGYADGLSRKMGNGRFSMRIRGGLAPTVGNVCMDMTMVDVTHLPDVRELDEVVIFDEVNRIEDLAKIEETIPYEILTRISERVRRVYVNE